MHHCWLALGSGERADVIAQPYVAGPYSLSVSAPCSTVVGRRHIFDRWLLAFRKSRERVVADFTTTFKVPKGGVVLNDMTPPVTFLLLFWAYKVFVVVGFVLFSFLVLTRIKLFT